MTTEPGVRFALDLGTATASAALLAPIDGRRRLLASVALPAGVAEDDLVRHLVDRLRSAGARPGAEPGPAFGDGYETVPRLVARSGPPPVLAVLATTVRTRSAVERVAGRAGWRTRGASLDPDGAIRLTGLALEADVDAIAIDAGEPTSREETAALAELQSVVVGLAGRDGLPPIVLLGAIGLDPGPYEGGPFTGPILGPGPEAGEPPGEPLRRLLARIGPTPERSGARLAAVVAVSDLAAILERRVELVEIGFGGAVRAVAGPGGLELPPAHVPAAALVPDDPDDEAVDRVLAWSTVAVDRHRMRDRLRELAIAPWAEASGDGARLRMAAARAALERLVEATPEMGALPAPDLILVAGGAWAAAPGPAVALAVADVVRRPGASQIAYDAARLLGPLGAVADPVERRTLLVELADDLLVPLGSMIVPQSLRIGRMGGHLTVRGPAGETDLDLVAGGIQLVDLPPGQLAEDDLRFRDAVGLGTRGRHVTLEVGGGLGGLLVDLRDVPLRLPDRAERRRSLLGAWEAAFWAGHDE